MTGTIDDLYAGGVFTDDGRIVPVGSLRPLRLHLKDGRDLVGYHAPNAPRLADATPRGWHTYTLYDANLDDYDDLEEAMDGDLLSSYLAPARSRRHAERGGTFRTDLVLPEAIAPLAAQGLLDPDDLRDADWDAAGPVPAALLARLHARPSREQAFDTEASDRDRLREWAVGQGIRPDVLRHVSFILHDGTETTGYAAPPDVTAPPDGGWRLYPVSTRDTDDPWEETIGIGETLPAIRMAYCTRDDLGDRIRTGACTGLDVRSWGFDDDHPIPTEPLDAETAAPGLSAWHRDVDLLLSARARAKAAATPDPSDPASGRLNTDDIAALLPDPLSDLTYRGVGSGLLRRVTARELAGHYDDSDWWRDAADPPAPMPPSLDASRGMTL